MPAAMPQLIESVDLTDLDQQHQVLRDEISRDPIAFRDNPIRRDEFVKRVEAFLELLQQRVPDARTTAAANSVNRIASEWQMIFTSELRIPKNIFELLQIDRVPKVCEPTLSYSASSPLRREVLTERIRERAYFISKDWKVSWLRQQLLVSSAHPERIHEAVLQLPVRTPADDWHEACTFLACDVLDARIDLALQLSVDGVEFLEGVWLDDVKRLKAYLSWEATRPDGSLDDPHRNYDHACREIHRRLLDRTIKAGAESFAPIANWLRDEVLDAGRINTATRPCAHALIERKARRLWECTKCEDFNVNWLLAEQYVRKFYENLIPAVLGQDRIAIETVLAATAANPRTQTNCEIVNALEVALVTYFFNPSLMETFFEGHITYL
jgi:hypothetical protein